MSFTRSLYEARMPIEMNRRARARVTHPTHTQVFKGDEESASSRARDDSIWPAALAALAFSTELILPLSPIISLTGDSVEAAAQNSLGDIPPKIAPKSHRRRRAPKIARDLTQDTRLARRSCSRSIGKLHSAQEEAQFSAFAVPKPAA